MGREQEFLGTHRLNITSLRDLQGHCSCGLFTYYETTTSRDSDAALRKRIRDAHREHVKEMKEKAP
jgi:hypothetical protein